MDSLRGEEELQRIAEFHQERARLRTISRASIVWGLINLGLGIVALQDHPINLILVLIGLFLLVEGIWFSITPSAAGVLTDGIVLLVIGLWNLFIVALDALAGEVPRVQWALLGLLFIGIALYRFTTYPRIAQLFQEQFAEEDLKRMDDLIRYVAKTKPREVSDIITFQTRGPLQQKEWRALLSEQSALFLEMVGKRVVVTRREDVSIEPRGKVLLSSTLKVRICIRDKTWNGLMSPTAFAKFQAWKLSSALENSVPAEMPPQRPTDAYTRRDQIQ